MKLSKYLAHAGISSRRGAEALITSGSVSVNGTTITNVATRVEETDKVYYKGKLLRLQTEHTTIAFYKPVGVITTTKDEKNRQTVVDILPEKLRHLKPVGRLDKNSEGLLLLTSDGDLHNKLTHPRYQKEKEYIVTVKGKVSAEHINQLQRGVDIVTEEESYRTQPARIVHVERRPATTQFAIIISEGKKRQLRLMCKTLGYTVTTLKRVRIGKITLQDLRPGKWKILKNPLETV